jgi:hypothetical protein
MGYYNIFLFPILASFSNLKQACAARFVWIWTQWLTSNQAWEFSEPWHAFLRLNSFTSVILFKFGNLVTLKSLDLSYNNLIGKILPILIYLIVAIHFCTND